MSRGMQEAARFQYEDNPEYILSAACSWQLLQKSTSTWVSTILASLARCPGDANKMLMSSIAQVTALKLIQQLVISPVNTAYVTYLGHLPRITMLIPPLSLIFYSRRI